MRLFEKWGVCESEVVDAICKYIRPDQFAYKKGHSSTIAFSYSMTTDFLDINRGVPQAGAKLER